MLSNILIALGFTGTGILIGLTLAAIAIKKTKKSGKQKSETKKIGDAIVTFVYEI